MVIVFTVKRQDHRICVMTESEKWVTVFPHVFPTLQPVYSVSVKFCIEVWLYSSSTCTCTCIEANKNMTLISDQQLMEIVNFIDHKGFICTCTCIAACIWLWCFWFFVFFLVLPVYRKRRVHKTVNLLTGMADANPADLVVSCQF